MAFKKALFTLRFTLPAILSLVPAQNAKNAVCCNLFQVCEDLLENLFDNECGDAAHSSLRLVFHDAIGIDPTIGGGGADSSIATFNDTELTFPANASIDDVLNVLGPFLLKWSHVLSAGDFIQFAGVLSLSLCPGAPQVQFAIGCPPPKVASPPNLVPNPFDTITTILNHFSSVSFSPEEVVALISSHSIAGANNVDPTIPGTPFDISPAIFDTQIFIDVQLCGTLFPGMGGNRGEVQLPVQGTLCLQSDHDLACDSRTACFWQSLAHNQASMVSQFGAAVFKLSLLGQNVASLTDCSDVIPTTPAFTGTASFPPSLSHSDIEQACATTAFPNLPTQPSPPLIVPPIP